jgi:hypothetical protein
MDLAFQIIGIVLSIGGVFLAVFFFFKSKDDKYEKVKREIIRTLLFQISEKRELSDLEINCVSRAKLRSNGFKETTIPEKIIIEDLISEIIENPLVSDSRKESIIKNLKELYYDFPKATMDHLINFSFDTDKDDQISGSNNYDNFYNKDIISADDTDDKDSLIGSSFGSDDIGLPSWLRKDKKPDVIVHPEHTEEAIIEKDTEAIQNDSSETFSGANKRSSLSRMFNNPHIEHMEAYDEAECSDANKKSSFFNKLLCSFHGNKNRYTEEDEKYTDDEFKEENDAEFDLFRNRRMRRYRRYSNIYKVAAFLCMLAISLGAAFINQRLEFIFGISALALVISIVVTYIGAKRKS